MIAIIDYGMGNLRSVQKALEKLGCDARITQDPKTIEASEKIVLPGVGAIKSAVDKLYSLDLVKSIKEAIDKNKPFLGICLGYQILFEKSNEGGEVAGLGILKGSVDLFDFSNLNNPNLKIPHMGWNQLNIVKKDCPLFKNIENLSYTYFCHSYFVNPSDKNLISTSTDYGFDFASSIAKNNLFGVQFHPEKSQTIGLKILQNFININ